MSVKHLVRTLGLALVAMAVMAVAASAAFGFSEWKAKGGGNPAGITFTGSGNAGTFETENKATVKCEKSKSKGKVLSSTEAEVEELTYEGKCTLAGASSGNGACSNVAGTENIKTEKLIAQPATITGGSGRGVGFKSANTNKVVAKFTCQNGVEITVTGTVICESTPVKTLSTTGTVKCKKGIKAGEQEFTKAEIAGTNVTWFLEAEGKVSFIKFLEKDSQETTETLTFSAEIEQT